MNIDEKMRLITRNAEEVITKEELKTLLETKKKPNAYIGFELSGKLHLGNGLLCAMKMLDLVNAGINLTIFLADWHSWVNNKLDGDLNKIHIAGEYFIDGFKALGLIEDKVTFKWASDLVKNSDYWATVIKVAKSTSLNRMIRALPIMGRAMETNEMESAWIYYPAMQASDIFYMDIDIAYGGMDQRKAHMITRDCANNLGRKKPIALHTPLITGLAGIGSKMDSDTDPDLIKLEAKMSKSKPETCIFIHDTEEELKKKMKIAYCPVKSVENNPIIEICKYIIFGKEKASLLVERAEKFGGTIEYINYKELEKDYLEGKLHPLDLKNAVTSELSKILQPVYRYFNKNPLRLESLEKMLTDTNKIR